MPNLSRTHLTTAAAVAAAALGGSALANAASSTSTSPSTTTTPTAKAQRGAGETALTGTTADKVKAAALAKVPGTVLRVETDNGGVYEAHIRKADGSEAEVHVDKDFSVTSVTEGHAGGRGGHGGGGRGGRDHADLTAVAKTLGVTEAKLQSAVDAARPAKGIAGSRGDHAANLAKELGVSTAAVQKVLDANHQAPGARGAKGDHTALIAALAKGLSLSEAKVKAAVDKLDAAHKADHAAERTVFYAAVAKSLGKSAADVTAAFEAAKPAATQTP